MRRGRLLVALGAVLAVVGAVVWPLIPPGPPRPGISQANCARIKEGTPRKQAEAILGGPPGEYDQGRLVTARTRDGGQVWQEGDKTALVFFDKNGKSYAAIYLERPQPPLDWWESLRRLLP